MIGIYKITNKITGKAYIGQSNNIKRRWQEHKTNIKQKQYPLYVDMNKYGIDNFIFEVLEECTIDELNEKEIFYINKFNTYYDGYNLTMGGNVLSAKTKIINDLQKDQPKLTNKQWQVYYYLLYKSVYDVDRIDKVRYIIKKDCNMTKIAKLLGSCRQTILNAIKAIVENGLIIEEDGVYYFTELAFPDINRPTFKTLLEKSYKNDRNIEALRLYLLLKDIQRSQYYEEDMFFTRRELITLLQHDVTNTQAYSNVKAILELLSELKLIEVEIEEKDYGVFGKQMAYCIKKINEIEDNLNIEKNYLCFELEKEAIILSERMFGQLEKYFREV